MVARVAHFWRKDPFWVWALPFTAYITLRDDYLDIVAPKGEDDEMPSDITLEGLDKFDAEKGVAVSIDYDKVLRDQRRGKAVRRG